MLDIIKPQIKTTKKNENSARFIIEPLERGFGHTLGNTMRRVLLSSLPGAAITSVQIEGIQHEFTSIPGVREDVIEVILNLKGVVARMTSPGSYSASIDVKGPAVITAKDIKCPGEIEIVNPEHYIAEIAEKSHFKANIRLEYGRGYVTAERNKRLDDPIGVIPIDALFSPIKIVTFKVENTRVGQRTDYDKLILEIETNGAIDPETAVSMAAQIAKEHLSLFESQSDRNLGNIFETREFGAKSFLSTPIEDLELSVRPYNCLKRHGIHTLEQLLQCTDEDMMNMRNFGQKSMEEVKRKLTELNLNLKSMSG